MSPRPDPADSPLARRLRREMEGEVLFDRFSRGRYATDASFYQIMPAGVAVPRTTEALVAAMEIAREEGVPVTLRGGGTSQSGQCIGDGLVVDTSKHLTGMVELDPAGRTVVVEPGLVLDRLNARLREHGLFFPVDPATASRATLGGMAGNNSAGSRSIRYGMMVDNVRAVEGVLADGTRGVFGRTGPGPGLAPRGEGPGPATRTLGPGGPSADRLAALAERLRALHARDADEIRRRFPAVVRNVAGYNLDRLGPDHFNLGSLLVGSEGTLALFTRLHLALQPLPAHRVLAVCSFTDLYEAVDGVRHMVALDPRPSAVELADRRLLELARGNPAFRPVVEEIHGEDIEALLLVEFQGADRGRLDTALDRLEELVGDLPGSGSVRRVTDPAFQERVWGVRKAGLNIAMSVKGEPKPVAFIEDCAVPLEHLAEYVSRMDAVFRSEGTEAIWYAHASVGTLHVRPALNLKDPDDVARMRRIAEQAHELVKEFGGSHSGEHGDGILRSEFHQKMLGERIAGAFREVKDAFDPDGVLNPGKIVDPPPFDDRRLFRYGPDYRSDGVLPVLDWSEWGGFGPAVEMCNNNGACRKLEGGLMCPSFRATRDERHGVRGRANSLRLAISGQLGPDAFTSAEMYETLALCVGCKGCRSECPTGVDVARMKIEFLHRYHLDHGLPLRERLVSWLPRYAHWGARLAPLSNLRNRLPPLRWLGEKTLGISARRSLPAFRRDWFGSRPGETAVYDPDGATDDAGRPPVVLFVDTFSRWFEPEIPRAAVKVLRAAGRAVLLAGYPGPGAGDRPLCCGRTFLNAGLVDEARTEAARLAWRLRPFAAEGVPIVGLEPSCLLTLRDELPALLPSEEVGAVPEKALLLEEYLEGEAEAGRLDWAPEGLAAGRLLVHGHCHQKSFDAFSPAVRLLERIPGADGGALEVEPVETSCCGMAGSFGYEARHHDVSMAMGELALLPAVRRAPRDAWIVADGTSCRQQIRDGTGRRARHVAEVLAAALPG